MTCITYCIYQGDEHQESHVEIHRRHEKPGAVIVELMYTVPIPKKYIYEYTAWTSSPDYLQTTLYCRRDYIRSL